MTLEEGAAGADLMSNVESVITTTTNTVVVSANSAVSIGRWSNLAIIAFSFLSLGRRRRHCYYSASVVSGCTQVLGRSLAPSPAFRTNLLRCVVGALFCSFTGRYYQCLMYARL